ELFCRQSATGAAASLALDCCSKEASNTTTRIHTSPKTKREAIFCCAALCREVICAFSPTRSGRCESSASRIDCLLLMGERGNGRTSTPLRARIGNGGARPRPLPARHQITVSPHGGSNMQQANLDDPYN